MASGTPEPRMVPEEQQQCFGIASPAYFRMSLQEVEGNRLVGSSGTRQKCSSTALLGKINVRSAHLRLCLHLLAGEVRRVHQLQCHKGLPFKARLL